MNLAEGLEVLVRDWIDLHQQGGSKLSLEAVTKKLGVVIPKSSASSAHIVELLMRRILQIPGALEIAENYLAQFSTPADLLDEMDLDSFACDLEAMEADEL